MKVELDAAAVCERRAAAVVTIVSTIIQIVAVRWALKAQWSDFRLQAVTDDQASTV